LAKLAKRLHERVADHVSGQLALAAHLLELLKQISVKKNYPLKKELADYFAALSAKDILSESEREELAYLSQIEVHLFK
jgi:thioredoxin-like negative regulator of GroEL